MNNKKTKPLKYSEVLQVALLSILLTAIGVGILKWIVYQRNQKIFATTVQIQEYFEGFQNAIQLHYKSYNSFPKPPADNLLTRDFLLNLQTTTQTDDVISTSKDPYNSPYKYYSDAATWYMIVSSGPDRDFDLDESLLTKNTKPTQDELDPKKWNPTNGMRSGGDLFLIGPYSVQDATQ